MKWVTVDWWWGGAAAPPAGRSRTAGSLGCRRGSRPQGPQPCRNWKKTNHADTESIGSQRQTHTRNRTRKRNRAGWRFGSRSAGLRSAAVPPAPKLHAHSHVRLTRRRKVAAHEDALYIHVHSHVKTHHRECRRL